MGFEHNTAKLNARPHWAKGWQTLTVNGEPMAKYLKGHAYKDQVPLFKAEQEGIGAKRGWKLADIREDSPMLFGSI